MKKQATLSLMKNNVLVNLPIGVQVQCLDYHRNCSTPCYTIPIRIKMISKSICIRTLQVVECVCDEGVKAIGI